VEENALNEYKSTEALAMTIKKLLFRSIKIKRAGNLQITHNDYCDPQSRSDKKIEDIDALEWVEK
jgi:RNA polymerase sigma-70 factor (ECF subfamily)